MKKLYQVLFFISCCYLFACQEAPKQDETRPNILYIYVDQMSASMMSCAGNDWVETPAMDHIA